RRQPLPRDAPLRHGARPDPGLPDVLLVAALSAPPAGAAAPAPRWYTHRLNRPAFYRAGAVLAGALPRPVRLALARGLARRAAEWFPAERARVRANLARVRPLASPAEGERLVDEVFRHFAICFADLISTNRREARPFPLGPFVLARAAGAPVVPAFCLLDRDLRYTVAMAAPIHVKAGEETAALAAWVGVLEAMVQRAPEQWFNFFDVWSAASAS